MSQDDEKEPGTALATVPAQPPAPARRELRVVEDTIPVFDTAQFEHMTRVAMLMADGKMLPDSLCKFKAKDDRGQEVEVWHDQRTITARAFMIVNQSRQWKADPFAVAQCTSFVYNRLCYEGKLVNALIESRLGIRLEFEFGKYDPNRRDILGERTSDGEWIGAPTDGVDDQSLGIRVLGKFEDETRPRWIAGSVGMWHKGSKSPWSAATAWPRQLRYMGAREWCRAYQPSLLLGILTDDEIDHEEDRQERRSSRRGAKADIAGALTAARRPTPDPDPQRTPSAREGFDQNHVETETRHDPDTGEVLEEEDAEVEDGVEAGTGDAREFPLHAAVGEMYLLAHDAKRPDGRWSLYRDGDVISSVGDGGLAKHQMYREHPPKLEPDPKIRSEPEDRKEAGPAADAGEQQRTKPDSSGTSDGASQSGTGSTQTQDSATESQASSDAPVSESTGGALAELRAMTSWLSLKQWLGVLRKSDDWGALTEDEQASVKRMIWAEAMRVKNDHRDPVDQAADPTAFSCWLETLSTPEHADAIDGTWNVLSQEKKYISLSPDQKHALEQAKDAAKLRCKRGSTA